MKNLLILFGGQSSEHDVSCISATTVASNVDTDEYSIHLVGITKQGHWLYVDSVTDIATDEWKKSQKSATFSPDAMNKELLVFEGDSVKHIRIDVAFPVLHGLYGEDGTVQGLFELAKLPYVGCGVLASSVSMDKVYTKIIVDRLGIRQAKYVYVKKDELTDIDSVVKKIEAELSYPVFVKPSNAGSSCGISKATWEVDLREGLFEASKHDRKILVEEAIVGREIECAVLGNNEVKASGVGEILAASSAEFYDYDAKYNNAESKTVIDPDIPADKVEEIRNAAIEIFKAVDGQGFARVDFFLEKDSNEVVFNEINTIPGFTSISMYPMLWEAKGIDKRTLVKELIDLAYTRKKTGFNAELSL
ncbi:MAG: D-alanine--D-alanine ligase [Lachnospiraceae bacterium]|nr:D-alanine--D-alanine ligase [Lachnospiraceae bacterium]